ncbi:predicted protein, partial [Nematostella vectensis]
MEGAGGAPLMNDYKLEFFNKRWPQTLLGGLKPRLGYDAPVYVYLNQLLLFLFPFILGGIFTILSEFAILDSLACCYVYGSLVTILVLSLHASSWFMKRKYSSVTRVIDNHLAQDDEIDFVSCCGTETLEFLFPPKRLVFNIVIHGLLSGPICALLFLYLLPANLMRLFASEGATAVLYIFGWITVCVGQYSLSSSPPPEPAVFHALDSAEIKPLMRPFYVLCDRILIMGIISSQFIPRIWPEFLAVDIALHIVFPFLLLLWLFGILPPLDALLSWLAEQFLVGMLGGSPMASDMRLFVMLLISSVGLILAVFVPSHIAVIAISSFFGYALSTDFLNLCYSVWKKLRQSPLFDPSTDDIINRNQWHAKEFIDHAVMLTLGVVTPTITYHFSTEAASQSLADSLGYVLIAVLVVVKILGDVQGVYLLGGLLRNPLFPKSLHSEGSFIQRKKKMYYVALSRHVILAYVSPLLMLAYLGLFLAPHSVLLPSAIVAFGTVRSIRQVWQHTSHSLLELCVACVINMQAPTALPSWWSSAGLGLQLMLIGACRDRVTQSFNKLLFLVTLAVTSYSLPKQRHKATVPLLIINIIFLPVLLGIVGAGVFLSAPLLPLFCMPLFIIGFPRPRRSWPCTGTTQTFTCMDASYYRQLAPEIIKAFSTTLASGAAGSPSAGDHFLARYQDRLVWVHVLECGRRYCSVVIKGLEMQETSCHTVEAARVDEVLDAAFIHEEKGASIYCNPYPLNVLRPCDAVCLDTYSDARNVLTGIIDQPDNLRKVSENFVKTTLWVLVNHCLSQSTQDSVSVHETRPSSTTRLLTPSTIVTNTNTRDTHTDELEMTRVSPVPSKNMAEDIAVENPSSKPLRSNSLPSLSGSVWSQESLDMSLFQAKPEKLNDVILCHDDDPFDLGGFPAVDIGKPREKDDAFALPNRVHHTHANNNQRSTTGKPVSAEFKSKHAYKLDLPSKWKADLPDMAATMRSTAVKFPTEWYKHVVNSLDLDVDAETRSDIALDPTLQQFYERLVLTCYAIVEVLGYPGSSAHLAGPSHVFKVFHEHIPWSMQLEWLAKNDVTLYILVLKAYRYAFKLTYDEAVIGDISDHEELSDYLREYDSDWFMGSDESVEWQRAVLSDRPNLFSIGKDKEKGTYTSRVLSKNRLLAPMGRLNPEAVRGQWAALALELLYLTNDDEERYSIQAHPTLLRNLTIQAADPPLGYPVYSS